MVKIYQLDIDWVDCSLELSVGAYYHTLIAMSLNSITYVPLSCLKQLLAVVKSGFTAWFGLHFQLLLGHQGGVGSIGGRGQCQGTRC